MVMQVASAILHAARLLKEGENHEAPAPKEGIVARKRTAEIVLEEMVERLDLMINLLGSLVASDKSITEGARLLKMAGLDNKTIANILNTSDATVRTLTANLRVRVGRRPRKG